MKRKRANPRKDKKIFSKTAKDKKLINAGVLYRGGIRL